MSSTSNNIPAGSAPIIVRPRLITVGRGRVPLQVQTEVRPGPAHHVATVSQSRPALPLGAVSKSIHPLGSVSEDSQPALRKPKFVQQEPGARDIRSFKDENKTFGLSDMDRNRGAASQVQQEDKYEKIKEELTAFKRESGANLEMLREKIEKLQKENDQDPELIISQKLQDIEANMKAKKGKVMPNLDQNNFPPPGSVFQFPDPVRPLCSHQDFLTPQISPQYPPPPPVTPQSPRYLPPPVSSRYLPPPGPGGFLPPVSQFSQPAAQSGIAPTLFPAGATSTLPPPPITLIDQSFGSAGQPAPGGQIITGPGITYHSFNRCPDGGDGDDLDYNNDAFIEQQKKIWEQIEEQKKKKKMEETSSLELIQKLSMEEDLNSNRQGSVSSYDSSSYSSSYPRVEEESWTKVARSARAPPRNRTQEKARKEQKEEEGREWQEWRQEMREKEEKARNNILQSHLDSQKVRMIQDVPNYREFGGPSKAPTVISATPVPALTLGDIVPEFEVGRRKAVLELRRRIKADEDRKRRREI